MDSNRIMLHAFLYRELQYQILTKRNNINTVYCTTDTKVIITAPPYEIECDVLLKFGDMYHHNMGEKLPTELVIHAIM